MFLHKVFTTEIDGRYLVYIPTLGRLFEVSENDFIRVPRYIEAEQAPPMSRWDNLKGFQFLGTNLLLTDACNLACAYCYGFGSPRRIKVVMEKRVAAAAMDYISSCAQEVRAVRFYANMFGGEPTQAFDILQFAVGYLREKSLAVGIPSRATITTNGVMEEEKACWLAENMDGVNLSMDGFKEVHNAHRSGSFDIVFKTARVIFQKIPQKVSFRVTVSDYSVESLPRIVSFFGEHFPGSKVFLEPLFAIGRGKTSKFGMPDHRMFFVKFLESIPVAKSFGCKLKTSVLNIGAKGFQFCGVAGNNFMIAPDGRVTVCNRMVPGTEAASERFIFGRFDPELNRFVFDEEKYRWLKQLTVKNVPECEDCFARSNCRGDCVANKAVIDPDSFASSPSYRCVEVREFVARALLYILESRGGNI